MSRQNPIPTNKNNPCVICGNDDGDCRVHHVTGDPWCMKLKDIVVGSVQKTANGSFKAKQLTSDRQWMIFNPTNERGETFKREYKPVERKSMANLMPSEVRDKNYRKLVSYRGLSQRHRQKLLDRGFLNDEIDLSINQNWLCSWESGISSAAYPDDLCGVNVEKNIFHGGSGIAFAYQDKCLIVGLNIANDSRDGAKYYPLSSRKSGGAIPNLPNGELPIFHWVHPEATEVQETWICEGTIKGLLTGFKLWRTNKNIQVIGIGGNNFLNYYKSIKPLLTIKNIFCPDAGMIDNSTVWENYSNFIKRLDQDKFNILVAWWGQVSKDDSDIDELDNFDNINFINFDEFRKLTQVSEELNTKIKPSKPAQKQELKTDDWEQLRAKTATYNLTRKADLVIESGYLPSLELSDIPSPLLGIKGNCGAGKSVFISNLLKNWNENIIQVAHLNNLLSNTAPKFDLMHHRELIDDLGLTVGAYSNLAITDISMAAKLDISAWLGNNRFILVLDEIEQVLKSIQLNKNLRGNSLRFKARVKIEWMIKNAAYVICSDRDLCDETIEYIEQIRGEKFYLIHHTGKKGLTKMPVKMVVNKDKTKVLQSLYSDIKKGLKVLIGCENRSDLTAIELELQKMGINDKEILTVHGENSNEKEIKDLIADIDKQYFNYRIFGYTSTLGTGISLDTQHFDKAYYFVSGDVLQASEIIQKMSRYRPDVDTTIWCNSITRKLEINPDNLLKDIQESLSETKGLINAIDKFDYFIKEGIFINPSGEIPPENIFWINHKLSIIARLNASRANPSKSLYDELVKDGYTVILDDSEVENNYLDAVHKANKEEIKLIQDQSVAKSEVMNDEQYKNARMNPGSLNKEEQAQFKKTRLVHELGVHETEINVPLVELERTKGVVKGAKALKIILGDKDTAIAYDLRDKESNPDPFDQSFYAVSWQYFHDLGFDKFLAEIKEDFSYSKDSELVIEIADKARKSASKFKRVIGIDISKKKSDCAIIGHLLDKLCILREKPEKSKNKARIYKINMQHFGLMKNAVEHINSQEKTLTMERLINSKIDQTMVIECAEVIRLAFEADNPVDEYELIKTVSTDMRGNEYPKLVKKLIFNQLTEDEQNRVRQTAKTAKELIAA